MLGTWPFMAPEQRANPSKVDPRTDLYSIAATMVMGANQAGFMTISHTIIQSLTEDHVRGRVAGVYSVHVGGSMAVTNMANAAIADVFSATSVMVFGGLIFVAVVVVSLGSRQLRRLYFPQPASEAVGAPAD